MEVKVVKFIKDNVWSMVIAAVAFGSLVQIVKDTRDVNVELENDFKAYKIRMESVAFEVQRHHVRLEDLGREFMLHESICNEYRRNNVNDVLGFK